MAGKRRTSKETAKIEEKQEVKEEASAEETKEVEETKQDESTTETEEKMEETKQETELDKYWRAVRENPSDFTGWTYLLQYVEQEVGNATDNSNFTSQLEAAREAYNAFFGHYPYCYGYWKKYADLEKRHGGAEKATEVFERGAKTIPLSVELWLHYINFFISEHEKEENAEDQVRRLYERAVAAAGTDFRSDKLWDAYIAWETNPAKITALYDRLLTIPIQLYSHHFENFKKHVLKHHPKEILSLDDFLKLRLEVVSKSDSPTDEMDTGAPGEDVPPGMETEGGKSDEEEANKLREAMIKSREEIFKKTEEEISKRWVYEEGIKRPYFHVKPLERSQLKNWREYLDYEIQNGSHERVVILFERCMIACALYEDFWMKYAKYMEDHSHEAVRNIYRRACSIHLPKKPYIHMAWAAFEERHGTYKAACDILVNLEQSVPGLVMVSMRRISLERRQGNAAEAERLFKHYIDTATTGATRAFFAVKYARYLFKILDDQDKARTILNDAIEKDPTNEKLYIQLLDFEYQSQPVCVDRALQLFDKMIENEHFTASRKIKMSQRRLEFLEDFGSSINKLKECYDDHQKLIKDLHYERKRKPSDNIHAQDEPVAKKSLMESQNGGGDDPSAAYNAYWSQYQNRGYGGYHGGWGNYGNQFYS